jgi:DNA-binding XRE family transcriptional regulator
MDLGSKIVELRKQKGYNRDTLGQIVGTSGAVIGRYERSEITPSVEIAKKIAESPGSLPGLSCRIHRTGT